METSWNYDTIWVWTSANTLALAVWHNTVQGKAEETRVREELAVEGFTG